MTGRQAVVKALYEAGEPRPIHALEVPGVSQATVSARLRELRRDGLAQKMKAPGSKFDLWRLTPSDLTLPLGAS
jgi:DNA-binding HxlR family transcriptional regulator